jgi:hypothetical protein
MNMENLVKKPTEKEIQQIEVGLDTTYRSELLLMLNEAYDYIKANRYGRLTKLYEYCGTSAVSMNSFLKGDFKKLNQNLAQRIFDYEDILRKEVDDELKRLINERKTKRITYQQSRADAEYFLEMSPDQNEETKFLNQTL